MSPGSPVSATHSCPVIFISVYHIFLTTQLLYQTIRRTEFMHKTSGGSHRRWLRCRVEFRAGVFAQRHDLDGRKIGTVVVLYDILAAAPSFRGANFGGFVTVVVSSTALQYQLFQCLASKKHSSPWEILAIFAYRDWMSPIQMEVIRGQSHSYRNQVIL